MKSTYRLDIHEMNRSHTLYRDTVRAAIASSPGRESELLAVLNHIAPQVDEIFVYLNRATQLPVMLNEAPGKVRFFSGPDFGESARFIFLDGFTGYYVPLSDSGNYSRAHVTTLIGAIERYERRAVVGVESGSIFTESAQPSYLRQNTENSEAIPQDAFVDSLQCDAIAFHTDTISLPRDLATGSKSPEAYLTLEADRQSVHLVAITSPLNNSEPLQAHQQRNLEKLDRKPTNTLQLDCGDQVRLRRVEDSSKQGLLAYSSVSRPKKISIIGRANPARWKKGGILKSVLLTEEMLTAHGCSVELVDIEEDRVFDLKQPDVVMIYVGDPERPDFQKVRKIVEHHAERGIPVLVNLSEDNYPKRTQEIKRVMSEWWMRYGTSVSLVAFSHNVASRPDYASFSDAIITLPKTLTFSHSTHAEYYSTSGIFIGDVAKIADPRLVGPRVQEHLRLLRAAIPEATIYGVQQYKSKYALPYGIDVIWPFMPANELSQKLVNIRLMISFPRYATFEMVPVEAAALGVPVLYPDMPQSLNEALGFSGYRYRSQFELINTAATLYRDPLIWRQYSLSGRRRASAQDFDVTTSKLYMAIKNFVEQQHGRKIWS